MMKYPNRAIVVTGILAVLFSCKKLELTRINKVTTGSASEITYSSAMIEGVVLEKGDQGIDQHGFYYATQTDPTSGSFNKSELGNMATKGSFSEDLSGLNPGTKYYYAAYLTNANGVELGEIKSFETLAPAIPVVTTVDISSISQTSAVSGGNVTDNGGATVTQRGVCWSISENPTYEDSRSTDGNGTGSYISSISGLTCNTQYYVRAYATNEVGRAYGNQVTFITSPCVSDPPTVTTSSISSITDMSAQGGGNVTNDGGAAVTEKGVCWSISPDPTVSDSKTIDGNGTGGFTSAITGLACETTYYVKAYARNSSGTSYGDQVTFTTSDCQTGLPVVATYSINSIQENSAQGGGTVSDEGGSGVTAKGICWSTSENPTTNENSTIDGAGPGGFTSALSNLSCGTTYYVRAYATNGTGTAYGIQESFTTSDCPATEATVQTIAVSDITETGAQSGGTITDDGGATITAKGVVWSTSSNPTTEDDHTTDGSGTESFTSILSGLSCGTTYYVRAYATNAAGTAYGNELTFSTSSCPTIATVTTTTISDVTETTAISGGNVTDDGGAVVTAKGIVYGPTSGPLVNVDNQTTNGSGTGSFTSYLDYLDCATTYYVRAYATNAAGTAYGNEITFTTSECSNTVTDYDGNVYQTVVIGDQTWMAENLRVTHYPDGTEITYVGSDLGWENLDYADAAYSYFDNNSSYADPHGALYTWGAVMYHESSSDANPSGVQGVCPSGWHVPSDAEWIQLEVHLGMDPGEAATTGESRGTIAGKLKETGLDHWESPNTGATNATGFTAIGTGYRRWQDGDSWFLPKLAPFWTCTESYTDTGYSRYIHFNITGISRYKDFKENGFAVRCVKD